MSLLSKLQALIILIAAISGLMLGMFTPLSNISLDIVEIFLILLLYILFLSLDLQELKKASLNVKYTLSSLFINFIITPIIAYLLGLLFFQNSVEIRIALVMLLVTPCTDWYLVFTKLARGNFELNLSLLPINLILQVLLLPIYLFLFFGNVVEIEIGGIALSIVRVLFIPFICAMITKYCIANNRKVKNYISDKSDILQLIFLCLAVVTMFASEGQNLLDNPLLLLKLFIPLLCFFTFTFFIAKIVGKIFHFKSEDIVSLQMTSLARNSPLALAIAVAVFPTQALISLALIIGPLIELPVLSIVAGILRKNKEEGRAI